LTADKPKAINCSLSVTSLHEESQVSVDQKMIVLSGSPSDYHTDGDDYTHQSKLTFESQLKVYDHNGIMESADGKISIKEADSITLVLAAATSFNSYDDISGNPSERCSSVLASITDPYERLLESTIIF